MTVRGVARAAAILNFVPVEGSVGKLNWKNVTSYSPQYVITPDLCSQNLTLSFHVHIS